MNSICKILFVFFKTLDYVSREEYAIKGIPDFFIYPESISASQTFLFLYQKTLNPNLTIFMFERVQKKIPYLRSKRNFGIAELQMK